MTSLYKRLLALGLTSTLAMTGAYVIYPKEGLSLDTYEDTGKIITACYGRVDPSFKLGQSFTQEECDEQLAEDLVKFHSGLSRIVKVPYQHKEQEFSLISFCYNVGLGNCKSSTLIRKFNSHDYTGACNEITRWVYVKGKDCRDRKNNCYGIVTRRSYEKSLCLGEVQIHEK